MKKYKVNMTKLSNRVGGVSFIMLGIIPVCIQVKPFNVAMCIALGLAGIFICRSKRAIFL